MATATKCPPSQQLLQEKQTSVTEGFHSYTTFSLMWNNTKHVVQDQEDDSWEVKAFEEDTTNILGATWPPRSYTCTFCGREFSSAQALGGHMNVHRRDRARLHQVPPGGSNKPPPPSAANASSFIIPPQEFVTNGSGGLCLLYSLPNPNGVLPPTTVNSCVNPPSTLLCISPCETNNIAQPCPSSMNFQLTPRSISSSACHSSNTEHSASITNDNNNQGNSESKKESAIEEIDLELRLGRRSLSTP